MVSNCVNPDCTNEFLYLRDGELFVVKSQQSVEYFWLCSSCAKKYQVVYDGSGRPQLVAHDDNLPSKKPAHSDTNSRAIAAQMS